MALPLQMEKTGKSLHQYCNLNRVLGIHFPTSVAGFLSSGEVKTTPDNSWHVVIEEQQQKLRRGCADCLLAWEALRDRMGVGKVLSEELGRLTFRIPEKREAGDM